MLDLRNVGIRVAVVDQRIQILRHFPDALLAALQAAIFGLLLDDEIESLLGVVQAIKLGDRGIRISLVITELFFRFALTIAGSYEIVPIVELRKRCVFGEVSHGFVLGLSMDSRFAGHNRPLGLGASAKSKGRNSFALHKPQIL